MAEEDQSVHYLDPLVQMLKEKYLKTQFSGMQMYNTRLTHIPLGSIFALVAFLKPNFLDAFLGKSRKTPKYLLCNFQASFYLPLCLITLSLILIKSLSSLYILLINEFNERTIRSDSTKLQKRPPSSVLFQQISVSVLWLDFAFLLFWIT